MGSSRFPQIGRRTALVAAIAVLPGALVAWTLQRESREVQKSRAIRLGMTQQEARRLMGTPFQVWFYTRSNASERWLVFGAWTSRKIVLVNNVRNRLGLSGSPPADFDDWPVRVRIDANGLVDRIERGDEVEQSGR